MLGLVSYQIAVFAQTWDFVIFLMGEQPWNQFTWHTDGLWFPGEIWKVQVIKVP